MCSFALDKLLPPVELHIGNRGLWRDGVGEGKKGVLHPYRQGHSTLFTIRPPDHIWEPPWPEIFGCLRNPRVRPPRTKKNEEGGKDPSEGQERKSRTLSGKVGLAGSSLGFTED